MSRNKSGQFKKIKLENQIITSFNTLIRTQLRDPRLKNLSFTRIELSDDNSIAKVYWDTYMIEEKEEMNDAISKAKGHFRSHLAKILETRSVPNLSFFYDSQFEDENKIDNLLKE